MMPQVFASLRDRQGPREHASPDHTLGTRLCGACLRARSKLVRDLLRNAVLRIPWRKTTTDYGLRTTDYYGLRTTDYGLRSLIASQGGISMNGFGRSSLL